MGRMFRIITESSLDYPGRASTATATENGPYIDGSAPYIEVGGPQPIFHGLPKLPARIQPTPPAAHAVEPPAAVQPAVRVADEHRYVARMHGIARKPAVESVPTVHPSIVAFHHPDHAVCDEYRGLRDELRRQTGEEQRSKAVLFTSAASDNGTTTVLLNIAVTLAKEPHTRVLVVDADFDRPMRPARWASPTFRD